MEPKEITDKMIVIAIFSLMANPTCPGFGVDDIIKVLSDLSGKDVDVVAEELYNKLKGYDLITPDPTQASTVQ